ncbi:unnamed protein product [Boreogadus saida]
MLNCAFPDSQGEWEREAGGVTRPTDEPQGGEPRPEKCGDSLPYQDILGPGLPQHGLCCSATCRRPIKGAAGRPVLYKYPDSPPTSPTTLERREVDARLVPVYAQVLVFLAIACLLYLVYACMEENPYHPLLPLLDGLSAALESQEEGPVGLAHSGDPAERPMLPFLKCVLNSCFSLKDVFA